MATRAISFGLAVAMGVSIAGAEENMPAKQDPPKPVVLALARPGAGTLGATVALGLGVLVVFTMTVVQDQLSAGLTRDLPGSSPTAFLADVQPDQVEGLRATLALPPSALPFVSSTFPRIFGIRRSSSIPIRQAASRG